jgi:hypothetical protein
MKLRYQPALVEEAVFLALMNHPDTEGFERERVRLYELKDPEARDLAFQDFHWKWFSDLGLDGPIVKALSEQPLVESSVKHCLAAQAPGKREEGAELFVSHDEKLSAEERRTVSIFLRPESLLDPSALLTFLRHELTHITDMLDPAFGYEPALPPAEGGPTHDRLLKDRYRCLWDATIDGRMARRGWGAAQLRSERFEEFRRLFPMFGEESESLFSRFFDQEPHSHAELVAFIVEPRALTGVAEAPTPGGRCPLCGFPTYTFEPDAGCLSPEVIDQITEDFPRWRPSHGLCRQCADLYRAHSLSAHAERSLPGAFSHTPSG